MNKKKTRSLNCKEKCNNLHIKKTICWNKFRQWVKTMQGCNRKSASGERSLMKKLKLMDKLNPRWRQNLNYLVKRSTNWNWNWSMWKVWIVEKMNLTICSKKLVKSTNTLKNLKWVLFLYKMLLLKQKIRLN